MKENSNQSTILVNAEYTRGIQKVLHLASLLCLAAHWGQWLVLKSLSEHPSYSIKPFEKIFEIYIYTKLRSRKRNAAIFNLVFLLISFSRNVFIAF